MPSPTDSNPIPTAAAATNVINPAHKDSSELSKEIRSQQVAVDGKDVAVDNANGVIHDDSDVVANTMTSGSSSSFIHDGNMNITTTAPSNSSTVDTNSINSTQNIESPVIQKSTQRTNKQHSTSRTPRRTRISSKGNVAVSQNDKDIATTPGSLTAGATHVASATSRSIIPASSSSSSAAAINATATVQRNLPSKDVTPENIGDRYLEFILYCNPSAPSDLDVSSLTRSFNAVPKSDGKTFETWVLFQLVSKHHSGEIKTWTKLAQQLGVERTNESSPQKIQQYAVRLKKWMRSIHIDAFFDYILSKPNEYYDEPHKNPTGAEPSSSGADDLDESDLVLKLIRRASSKRQKRKYTRRNNGGGTDAGNSGGNANDEDDEDDDDDDDDDDLDLDDGGATKSEKHRGKRVKATTTYSDRSEDEPDDDEDRDAWGDDPDDMMHIDNPNASSSKITEGKKSGSLRRKSVVQFASQRENIPKLGKPKNIITHNIPTPNPSPTTMPDIKLNHNLSGGTGDTGNFRMLSNPGTVGSPGTQQLRWRSISVGGGPTSSQAGDMPVPQSFTSATPTTTTTSQTQKGNNNNNTSSPSSSSSSSRRKQSGDASGSGHFDSFRLQNKRQQKQQDRQSTDSSWTWTNNSSNSSSNALSGGLVPEVSKDNNNDSFSYSELLIPPTTVSSDPNITINLLQNRLVKAVGMLEENQRKIDMLENVVRQREEEVRRRAARGLKDDVIKFLQRWE